ncbi:MAG: ABC transporter permease, partial [Parasporobacterium sp.]|nr:ABC transporter permease [Parasporobacterium sp.]
VAAVTCIDTMIDEFADVLKGINAVTYVLIVCAGALTFVVLYNLNNINISERRRELATLKVLGFYDKELSQYIYRENILITIIGVALGVLGGYFLNSYVVTTVEVDMVMFGREIFPMSYVASVLIAIGFTAVVNIIVHFKLKKIDMATSLKSVE